MSRRISLGQRAQQYLAERRRLGFELSDMEEALESFTEYAEAVVSQRYSNKISWLALPCWSDASTASVSS